MRWILPLLLLLPLPLAAEHGDHVVMAEILVEGSAARDEYVELYNPTAGDVNLENWKLVKATASGNEANLVGAFPSIVISAHGSLLICAPDAATCSGRADVVYTTSNSLATNNTVTLKNADGVVIDRVGWGEATLRESTTAANPTENQSLERKPGGEGGNGQDTDNNASDFQLATPNPQNKNVAVRPALSGLAQPAAEPSGTTGGQTPSSSTTTTPSRPPAIKIKINELYPNPPQSDFDEFIELKNEGEGTVDLTSWILKDPNGVTYTLERLTLAPAGLNVITRKISGLALRNGGGKVELLNPQEKREDSVSYDGPVEESVAYARDENGKWKWTTKPTPNATNEIATPNRPPIAFINAEGKLEINKPITLEASDSNDPDGDPLTFIWTLPDGTRREGQRLTLTQLAPAKLTIVLTVRDDKGHETTIEKKLIIGEPKEISQAEKISVRFSEIVPNPEGSDVGEWLEIENLSDTAVSLAGFRLSDGARTRELPEGVAIPAKGFVILAGPTLKISLPNRGGALTFTNPTQTVLDTFAYPKLDEGTSYARTSNGTWTSTTTATPGSPNVIKAPEIKTTRPTKSETVRDISPDEIYDLPLETRVRLEGVVTAPAGLLGATRFALAGALLETRQDINHLKTGNRVRVSGTIRDRNGVRVVYIGKNDEIIVLGNSKLESPRSFDPQEVSVNDVGTLVSLEGVVQSRRGKNLTVRVAEQDLDVTLPQNLEEKFSKDTPVRVTGVLTKNSKGWRVVTRTAADIMLSSVPTLLPSDNPTTPISPFTIPLRQRPPTMTLVFLASLIGLGLVGIGLWIYEKPRPVLEPIYAPGEPLTPHVETIDIPITVSDREDRA